jgi:Big-like domain-containing protein
VNPINSVTNLSLSEPDPGVVHGEFVDLNATITDANNATLVNETGTVTFSYVTPSNPQPQVLATVNMTRGKATFRTNALPAAQYNFFAKYNGSRDFNASASNPHTFSVNPASTRTAITSPASGTTFKIGQPIVINFQVAVVPPGGGIISGESVTIQDPNFADSSCTGKLTGTTSPFTGSCTITPQTAGTR